MNQMSLLTPCLMDIIHPKHALVKLSDRFPWDEVEKSILPLLQHKNREGNIVKTIGFFGVETFKTGVGISPAGRKRKSIRCMAGLLYLKHAFNLSDEQLIERWQENPYWQYFCGETSFQLEPPCDATTLMRFRKKIGEEGCEWLFSLTIKNAVEMKMINKKELESVVVDTTVQEKAVAYPTDSRLLDVARRKLVLYAKRSKIELKQTFDKEGKQLLIRAGRYAHARQMNRLGKMIKRQKTILGKLVREIERRQGESGGKLLEHLKDMLEKSKRLIAQKKDTKNKLYSVHAPEVECISKGKARIRYEFGVKASVAVTSKKSLVVGVRTFRGNPYDGDTLENQLEQSKILMEEVKGRPKPNKAFVDLGYRGRTVEGVEVIHKGKIKRLTKKVKALLKRRRPSVEPVIGHLKEDCRMGRCHLKGSHGDAIHAVLCGAGYNLRWLLRAIDRRSVFCARILGQIMEKLELFWTQFALPDKIVKKNEFCRDDYLYPLNDTVKQHWITYKLLL